MSGFQPTNHLCRAYQFYFMIKFLVLISFRGLFVAGEHLDKDTMQWARRAISAPVYDNWWQTGRSFLDTRKKT